MGEPPGMDPNYGSDTGGWKPVMQAGQLAWVRDFRDALAAQLKAELRRQLHGMPSGQRIRYLRAVNGWTQQRAAVELGVSVRTIIRHEQGQKRHPWLRLPLLERLRELESIYAEQLIAYLGRVRREHD